MNANTQPFAQPPKSSRKATWISSAQSRPLGSHLDSPPDRQAGIDQKILTLDNHDDFGGHAKRNEFDVGGRMLLGVGGSVNLETLSLPTPPSACGAKSASTWSDWTPATGHP